MIRNILAWLEDRTGLPSGVQHFLNEEIPASSGWKQVFGSVALFCFLTQFVTGLLLALNYAPTPGEAYNSLKYILTEVTGGRLLRGLHHWGASMMIVVVVLHLLQTFLYGAYKKPREATWLVGCVLLLLTLGYGLTGYLLPWDNRAYWGTVVATQIAAKAPGAGPYLTQLLGSADGPIGVVTFARFYAIHVLLLPPLTLLLIGLHVFLVRKHGVAPEPGDENLPKKKFYPVQVFKDTVAIFAAFLALFLMAAFAKVPLERLADPTDTSYIPRPDWYFLWLFQLLKFFEGPLEIVGSMILPGLATALLFAVPFLDRAPAMRLAKRTFAFAAAGFALLAIGGLTAAAVRSTPSSAATFDEAGPVQNWQQLSPEELAGVGYYRKENCASCHPGVGPDLTKRPVKRDAAWMIDHFKNPQKLTPGSQMPAIHLSNRQLNSLAAFLLKLNEKNSEALQSAPAFAVDGAMLYQAQNCGMCHQVNGIGQKMGPSLNGVAQRRTREWLEGHFVDPQKFSPGSTMPPYKFNPKEMEAICRYLETIPAS